MDVPYYIPTAPRDMGTVAHLVKLSVSIIIATVDINTNCVQNMERK